MVGSGKVKVSKTEKPTQHGAWIGHLAYGTSRKHAKEIGALLPEGGALLIVVGVDKDAKAVQKAVTKAAKKLVKTIKGDYKAAKREVTEMLKQV